MSTPLPLFSDVRLFDEQDNDVSMASSSSKKRYRGPRVLRFRTTEVPLCVINSIRREITGNLLNVIVDRGQINVRTNMSPLNDDQIRSQLVQVPIHLTEQELREWHEFGPYTFYIKVQNASTNDDLNVTSKDIQVYSVANRTMVSSSVRDRLFPPHPITGDHVSIMRLRPSILSKPDEIDLEFRAVKGVGQLFNPTSRCFHSYEMNEELIKEQFAAARQRDPDLTETQYRVADGPKLYTRSVAWAPDPKHLRMTIHSETCLSPVDMVGRALEQLIERTNDLIVRMNQDNGFRIEKIGDDHCFAATVDNETHTMGNLVQSLMYTRFKRGDRVKVIAYNQMHPSESVITFKLQLASSEDPRNVFEDGFRAVIDDLRRVRDAWIQATASIVD